MRAARWIGAACLAGGVGAVVLTGSDAQPSPAAAPPQASVVRDCGSRSEPSGRPGPGAIHIGPLAVPAGFGRSPASTFASRAGQSVVLAVAPEDRAHAALLFAWRRGRQIGPY